MDEIMIIKKYKYGYAYKYNRPFSIEKYYKKAFPTRIYTPGKELTVNQLYELCDGLLHISKDVKHRVYQMRLYNDYLYLNDDSIIEYGGFNYKFKNLNTQQIINHLKIVFYKTQPMLQGHSLVRNNSDKIEDDPNYYFGNYVLNDNNEYTILKCKNKYKFYKNIKKYYPDWKLNEDLIYEDEIDFDIYKLSLEYCNLQSQIVNYPYKVLNKGLNFYDRYFQFQRELNNLLNIIE